jgi:hypothetical protein
MSPTTARDLLDTLRANRNLDVVAGERLPWAASSMPVMVIHQQRQMKKKAKSDIFTSAVCSSALQPLFATLPTEPAILAEKRDLQPWLTSQTPNIDQTTFVVTWVDPCRTPTMGFRKPDIVHYLRGHSPSVYELAYFGDLKGQSGSASGDPSDESITSVMAILFELAAVQVWRRRFIGYLLDGKHVSFFVAVFDVSLARNEKRALVRFWQEMARRALRCLVVQKYCSNSVLFLQVHLTQSIPMLCSADGGRFLRGLLEAPLEKVGASLPLFSLKAQVSASAAAAVQQLAVDRVLGLGATSTVFGSMDCSVQ